MGTAQQLTWDEVCGRRLARSYLLEPATDGDSAGVVGAVCGIQAQVMSAAELDIAARVAAITREDVRQELWERRGLVKTYGPRETLHLLPASELPLWMAAMRARDALSGVAHVEQTGLEPAQVAELTAAIGAALDGRCLTREELTEATVRSVGEWARERVSSNWGEPLAPAAQAGLLCFGPSQGSRVTFVRADQWIGGWAEVDPDAALREVCRRYFAAYGPATYQDFGRWFSLRPADSRAVLDSLGDELMPVDVEGARALMLCSTADDAPATAIGSVRLVPQYDCYVLGTAQRERVMPDAARPRIFAHGRGRFEGATGLPVLLLDGIVSGIWQRPARGKRVEIRVEPFVELTPIQRDQVEAEAAHMGLFLGAEVIFSLGAL